MSSTTLPYKSMLSYVAVLVVATSGFMFLEYMRASDHSAPLTNEQPMRLFGHSESPPPVQASQPDWRQPGQVTPDGNIIDDTTSVDVLTSTTRPVPVTTERSGQQSSRKATGQEASFRSVAPALVDETRPLSASPGPARVPTTANAGFTTSVSTGGSLTPASPTSTATSAADATPQVADDDPSGTVTDPESQYVEIPPWEQYIESRGCLAQLPPGSTRADADAARLATGCIYGQQCSVRNDRSGGVDCYWYFRK